jgi:hypothetical protein
VASPAARLPQLRRMSSSGDPRTLDTCSRVPLSLPASLRTPRSTRPCAPARARRRPRPRSGRPRSSAPLSPWPTSSRAPLGLPAPSPLISTRARQRPGVELRVRRTASRTAAVVAFDEGSASGRGRWRWGLSSGGRDAGLVSRLIFFQVH